jgi:hypothetical protein
VVGFTIPDEVEAAFAPQARLFQSDLEILALAHGATGVISGCAVTAQGTPDMTVAVAAGVVQSLATRLTVAGGNATITTADGTHPRLDIVVVTSGNALAVRAGTPAASPLLPSLTAGDVALARVYVPASDTAIGSTQIVDARVLLADFAPRVFGGGDDVYANYAGVGFALDYRVGTAGAPNATLQPLAKLSRTISVTQADLEAATASGADGGELLAALSISAAGTATCEVQSVAIHAYAKTASTATGGDGFGNDALAMYSVAQAVGSASGFAIGAFSLSRRDNDVATMTGHEVYNANYGTVNAPYNPNGAGHSGIQLAVLGNADSGAAIVVRNPFGRQWETGLAFTGESVGGKTGGVRVASIWDSNSALTSLLIQGTHSTAAIAIADGSGRVGIGTVSPTAALHVAATLTDPAASGVILSPQMNLTTTGKAGISANSVYYPTAALADIYALQFIPLIYGDEGNTSRGITTFHGAFFRNDTHSGFDSDIGTVRNVSASGSNHNGGGTISVLIGLHANINIGQARVTNGWQLYCEGNAPSFFGGNVQIADKDIVLGTATGTKIGTATNQKLAFFAGTPVVQRSAYTQTYSTATRTHANLTAAALSNSFGTGDTTIADVTASHSQTILNNNFRDVSNQINALVTDLTNLKQVVNSLIDDEQALALCA